jgi:hypothetical protein
MSILNTSLDDAEPDPADDPKKLARVHELIKKFEGRLRELELAAEWPPSEALVWHYTSLQTAINIVAPTDKPPALRACSSEGWEDEHDGRWLGHNLGRRIPDRFHRELLAAKAGLFATSLTFDQDSQNHWSRRYGDFHHGVALGFRVSALQAAARKVHSPRFITVLYTPAHDPVFDDLANILADLKRAVFSLSDYVAGTKRGFWIGTKNLVAKFEWYFKDAQYEAETETRIAFDRPAGGDRPYVEVPLEGALEEIILGSRCAMTEPEMWELARGKNPNLRSITRSGAAPIT